MLGKHKKLLAVWDQACLDIRQTKNGRWFDQKVTPDVMAAVCGVVVAYCNDSARERFTVRNLWESEDFKESVERDFGKPSPQNPGAASEYDKFIAQPLNVLRSAQILKLESERPNKVFRINSDLSDVLHKMADSERETAEFLNAYIEEVFRQSGLLGLRDGFFARQDESAFQKLKAGYSRFIIDNTRINTEVECNRIFAKVVNIPAYFRRSKGAEMGKISRAPISLSDIRYNRINFRDAAAGKPKDIPRQQYQGRLISCEASVLPGPSVRRVVRDVKDFHKHEPEIRDRFSAVNPKASHKVDGHHIFPQARHPLLARFRENIILLTPTQHGGHAHAGDSGFGEISQSYQHLCLQKKLESVEKCDKDLNCVFYSFSDYKKMLFMAGIIDRSDGGKNGEKLVDLTFDDVRRIMSDYYAAGK